MGVPRLLMAALCSLALILASCSALGLSDSSRWRGSVGGREVKVQVGAFTVLFPAEVAPAGTRATVQVMAAPQPVADRVLAFSDVVAVTLAGGLQPQAPVQLTLPVNAPDVPAERLAEQFLLFVSAEGEDGSESYTSGTFDAQSGTYSVSVKHFTGFRLLGIDLGVVLGEVRTAIMQGLGMEMPAPACAGVQAEVNGTKYDIVSTPMTHLCVEESGGNLVVTAYPGSAMPYLIRTAPQVEGVTEASELGVGTAMVIALAHALGFFDHGQYAAAFPGGQARFVFKGAPSSVALELEQYPALLLMAILTEVLDTLGITSVGELSELQCLVDIAETDSALRERLDAESVGSFIRSFFSCAGAVAELSTLGRFLLAAVGAAPAFLVTSIVGLINEFTSQARYEVALTVTRRAAIIGLEEGGGLVIGGIRYGRKGPEEIKVLTDALGQPDAERTITCQVGAPSLIERRWGDLIVFSLTERAANPAISAVWGAGGISGWRYDPTLSTKAFPRVNPPKGIVIGTRGATAEAKYRADEIFAVERDSSSVRAFAGDTVDITFDLDAADQVAAMRSGWGC